MEVEVRMRELRLALVADDSRISRMILREALAGLGVEVLEAANGEEALEVILSRKPDLVVSDILMPKADGFAVATKIREAEMDPPPVLFLLSAVYKGAKWRHEALTTYGAHEFLAKPVDAEALEKTVRKHFDIGTKDAEPAPEDLG